MRRAFACVILLLPLAAFAAPAPFYPRDRDTASARLRSMNGWWEFTYYEWRDDGWAARSYPKTMSFQIKGDELTKYNGSTPVDADRIKLYGGRTSTRIDFSSTKTSDVELGLYTFVGDTLTLVVGKAGASRPASMDAGRDDVIKVVLTRKK